MKVHRLIFFTFLSLLLICCNKEQETPLDINANRVKSIYIATTGDTMLHVFTYNSQGGIQDIRTFFKPVVSDTFALFREYLFEYGNNTITIDESRLDQAPEFHRYKIHYDRNKQITAFNKVDTSINMEYPYILCVQQNNRIDSFYEKAYFPGAFNRICYDYQYDGNNYTGFKFEYDYFVFGGSPVHVKDSAKIEYIALNYTPIAPMQNAYSANTLFNLVIPGEVFEDIIYLIGIDGYTFARPNRNLVSTIRSFHDTTAVVYMDYEFNSNNQLKTFTVNFGKPTDLFFTYSFTYY